MEGQNARNVKNNTNYKQLAVTKNSTGKLQKRVNDCDVTNK